MFCFFSKTVESLVSESGCALEHPKASDFRTHVLNGDWEKVGTKCGEAREVHVCITIIMVVRVLLYKRHEFL